MRKQILLSVSILLGCIILGGFYYVSQVNKQKSIIKQLESALLESNMIAEQKEKQVVKVELYYNNSTGELYPLLPDDVEINVCAWDIWGDHGSDLMFSTNESIITNESNEFIKLNNFLPPRVPIYMTCIDRQNRVYQGAIAEYK